MQLEDVLETVLKKVPNLRPDTQQALVRNTPTIVRVAGVLGLVLSAFLFLKPYVMTDIGFFASANRLLQTIFNFIASAILLLSATPLKKRQISGWRMLYYLSLIELLLLIITFNITGLLALFLVFYLLFQIKPQYEV